MKPLVLNMKSKYFDQIKSGEKQLEYRLYNDFWKKRLSGKSFSEIIIRKGYPKAGDTEREIKRPWKGYTVITGFKHEHFGDEAQTVFGIVVNSNQVDG